MRQFYVYILASKSRVLYTGITDNIHRLVYYETFKYVKNAIAREKCIKGWLRRKKIALIEADNPTWEDLSEKWFDRRNCCRRDLE